MDENDFGILGFVLIIFSLVFLFVLVIISGDGAQPGMGGIVFVLFLYIFLIVGFCLEIEQLLKKRTLIAWIGFAIGLVFVVMLLYQFFNDTFRSIIGKVFS